MFKILDGREQFYQWDLNRKLVVGDASIREVHFCNRTDNCSLTRQTYTIDGIHLVDVPDILLQTDWRINVYAFDGNYTKHSACFKVVSRTKPENYVFTDTEVKHWDDLEGRITELESKASDDLATEEYVNTAITNATSAYFSEVSYTEKQVNLFDKDLPREKGFVCPGPVVVTSPAHYQHLYFEVDITKTYTFPIYYGMFGSSGAYQICCYDANKSFVGHTIGTPKDNNQYLTIDFTNVKDKSNKKVDSNLVKYITVNTATDTGSATKVNHLNFMIVEGSVYPSEYYPYIADPETITAITLNPEIEVPQITRGKLYGKSVVFTGDSICAATTDETGVKGWAERIGVANNMNWTNKGVNGATITDGISHTCIAKTDFGSKPDYIILEGGTNDADIIGTPDNFTPENFGSFTLGDYTSDFDVTTFCGAVEYLFKRVTTDYAGAKVGFIIAHKMGTTSSTGGYDAEHSRRRFYFETIIKLCEKWGIPYLDLWNGCYLCPMNPAHNTPSTNLMYNGDYQHLASRGYNYVSPIIQSWMETL